MSAAADLVLTGIGRLVTMDPQRAVITGAAVAVGAGRILAVGAEAGVLDAHPAAQRFDARGGWVTPGFVNAHQHLTGDRLARASIPDNLAPGVPVFSWALPLHAALRPPTDPSVHRSSLSQPLPGSLAPSRRRRAAQGGAGRRLMLSGAGGGGRPW